MAGFNDSNDIKISVTLDTKSAVESIEQLKDSIKQTLALTKSEFLRVAEISKQLNKVAIENIKSKQAIEIQALANQDAANKRSHDARMAQLAIFANTSQQKISADLKATLDANNKKVLSERNASRERIVLARVESKEVSKLSTDYLKQVDSDNRAAVNLVKEAEKTKRQELKQTLEDTKQLTAIIRKMPAGSIPRDALGVGKDMGQFPGLLDRLGAVLEKNQARLTAAASGLFLIQKAASAAIAPINLLISTTDRLSQASGKLEGLQTGFETLQRSVGRLPTESIERLRVATQGLISDTELYQKANQAVLLQVPAALFEESAEAAVKLGRAMGIDAAFALESLSIGLGRQSRLYLDNLGIVVSATEAYRNFAVENNKLVSDLTESDKRLAFFNETSKKLKEGLATLPPIQQTVGTQFRVLTTTIENLQSEFLKGFNSNKDLANSYTQLSKEADSLGDAFKRLGDVYASLIGFILKNPLSKAIISTSVGVVEEISKNLADKFGTDFTSRIARAQKEVLSAERELEDFRAGRKAKIGELTGYDEQYYKTILEAARLTVTNLEQEQKRAAAIPPVGIKVNTEELDNQESAIKTKIEEIKQAIGEDLGVVKIRGVEQSEVDAAIQQVAAIGEKIQTAKISAADAQVAIENVFNSLAESAKKINIADINKLIEALNPVDKGYAQALAQLTEERKKYQQRLIVEPKQLERINKVTEIGLKLGKDRIQQIKGQGKETNKIQKELEAFTKGLNRSLEQAIPTDFQQKLVDIFNDPQIDARDLAKRIYDLGIAFKVAGGDTQAFIREAGKLKDLRDEFPDLPFKGTSDDIKAAGESTKNLTERLAKVQELIPDIKSLFSGEAGKGGFFGFDLGEAFSQNSEQALAIGFQGLLSNAFRAGADGFQREEAGQIASDVSTTIGTAIGAYYGDPATGAQIGNAIGNVLGPITQILANSLGKDKPGTKERKSIDSYFAELFDRGRLSVLIQGQLTGAIDEATGEAIRDSQPRLAQLSDLVFEGFTPFAGNVSFGGEGFRNYFDTLSTEIQASFNGVGLALGTLQGIAVEEARLIGVALSNNIGGSLQNLQVLVQQTGESFDDLAAAIIDAFVGSQLSIEEAYNALVQLQGLYEVGIPNAIGAWQEANSNLFESLKKDNPGQFAIDSLRDIGAEGLEARASFETVIAGLAQTFDFTGAAQSRLFEALRASGIASLEDLKKATDAQLITLLRNIDIIRQNAEAPLVTTPTVAFESKPSGASRGGGKSKAQQDAERLREEIRNLTRESLEYQKVLERIASGELTRIAAGAEIIKIQAEIEKALKRRNDLEKKLEAELDKGRKANKKRLADLAAELDTVNKQIDGLTKKAEGTTRVFKELTTKGVIPFIKDANNLGVLVRQVGVSFEKATDILVKGFLQGRLSLAELNSELDKTKETLGPGIPNAVGAVTDAFQNLIDAGTQGGQFSVDAFTDIFAEFREKFQKEGSALREAERKQLNENLKAAREAFAAAVGPESTAAAKKTLDAAKKALDDFYSAVPAPDLSDLRDQLQKAFGREEVDKFFQALDESGLKTFSDFEKAGVDSVVGILGRLQQLGFNFNQTSQDILDTQAKLREAEKEANAGLDPMQEAINLIKGLNEGAAQLPPVFNTTTAAIESLNGPLSALNAGFGDIVDKLAKLSNQTFENDVVFNIKTVGDAGGRALVETLFGDGQGTTSDIPSTRSGTSESSAAKIASLKKRIAELKRRGLNTQRRKEIARLQRQIAELGG